MADILDLNRAPYLTVGGTPTKPYFDWQTAEYKNIKFLLPPIYRHVCTAADWSNSPGIAFQYYKNTDYWWVVCQYNGIIDPITEFWPGRVILLPGLPELNAYLAERRKWYPDPVDLDYVHPEPPKQILGPLIVYGLITNAYHNVLGRGGYFHWNSGTSEGQSIGIEGSLLSYYVLNGGFSEEQDAADWYMRNALAMLDALGNGTDQGPLLRQRVPDDPNTICMLHWLFAARGHIPSQGLNWDYTVPNYGGSIVIPANVPEGPNKEKHRGGADVFRVWQVYPDSSYLLYPSPYSPSYDLEKPTGNTSVMIDKEQVDNGKSPNWIRYMGDTVEVSLPVDVDLKVRKWKVIYGYNDAGIIPMGAAQEAYPFWTGIEDGYSACAPDTYRWFDYALDLAIEMDRRPGQAHEWTKLRDAVRRTCVRGQNITDLREVIKPLPQFEVIPIKGEPSGMFCFSQHPKAEIPTPEQIAAGASDQWSGFNFWSRIGGSGGTVSPGEFTWTPQVMLQPEKWTGDIFNGAIAGFVPATEPGDQTIYQTQFGRGFNDEWRGKTTYQDEDQFVFVAMTSNYKPNSAIGERLYIYLSSTKYYSEGTRWYADLGSTAEFQTGLSPDGGPRYYLIPRSMFLRKDMDSQVLPIGTRFENFGVHFEVRGEQEIEARVVFLRIVGGESAEWIRSNMAEAVGGAPMPFFPGAIPFATNADIPRQQFVGFNGTPFHGYQLPDHWYKLGEHAEYVHPNLTVKDLPIPDRETGAITYPINPNTRAGTKKPKHALLMEQQLLFLKHAQEQYVLDGGTEGPFAHTFVLNTPARMSIGNPTPHTWVYTNDDPNTRWCGYQSRVIDSLGRLVYTARNDAGFTDCVDLSLSMVYKWIKAFDAMWPDLGGKFADGSDTFWVYGPPTDYPDPKISKPQTFYEEPHAPALVLRGCVWLKASGKLTPEQLEVVERVGVRIFKYIQFLWIGDPFSPMRWSWGSVGEDGTFQYYGFWVFEILSTMAYMIKFPTGIPTGINIQDCRDFIRLHYRWLIIKGNVIWKGDEFDPAAHMYDLNTIASRNSKENYY